MNLSRPQLVSRFRDVFEADLLRAEPEALAAHSIAGKPPALVCSPETAEQVSTALLICAAAQAAVVPWGGGTAMAVGNPPRDVDVIISTKRLNRIIEHDHANLTVTAQSGAVVSALQSALAAHEQFLPFDPPFLDRSTIGGVIAANLNGPRRGSLGSVRDLVIGVKAVLSSGEQIKAGGKVVKNVAGYDMCKLFTGSLGTLGLIIEATLRVAPLAEESATAVARGNATELLELAQKLDQAKLLPSAVFLTKGAVEPNWLLAARFEGFGPSVARQVSAFDSLAQRTRLEIEIRGARSDREFWRALADLPLQANRLIYRMTVPPASIKLALNEVEKLFPNLLALSADVKIGTLWIVLPANGGGSSHFEKVLSLAQGHQGHAILFAAPAEEKIGIDVWGPSPPTIGLMREIKSRFDPREILNPGRLIGGI